MNIWDLKALDLKPRLPEILSSSDAARVIALDLAAGETLSEHEVHERAWILVIEGAIEVTTAAGEHRRGSGGLLIEFAPGNATRCAHHPMRGCCCCSPPGRGAAIRVR